MRCGVGREPGWQQAGLGRFSVEELFLVVLAAAVDAAEHVGEVERVAAHRDLRRAEYDRPRADD